jgi:release factor glutamine methyltransferase
VRLVTLPGVFRPISDTWLLADALDREPLRRGARVLDLCSGSGALAVRAAIADPSRDVTAVDVSRRAVLTIRLNAALNRVRVDARRGNLFGAVAGRRFDAIVSNPPYVPAPTDALPTSGPERAWDAGRDGRALLDRIVERAADHLLPGGVLLVVHSSLLGLDPTAVPLREAGLDVDVAANERGPLGPLMRARREAGLIDAGTTEEDVLVVRARKPASTHCRSKRLNVTM